MRPQTDFDFEWQFMQEHWILSALSFSSPLYAELELIDFECWDFICIDYLLQSDQHVQVVSDRHLQAIHQTST